MTTPQRGQLSGEYCLNSHYKGAREELAGRLNYWNEPLYTEIFRFSDADSAAVK